MAKRARTAYAGRRRSFKRRRGTYAARKAAAGRRAFRFTNTAARGSQREYKNIDLYTAATAIVAPTDAAGGEVDPTVNCLNANIQGAQQSNRIGSKIWLKSIQIKGLVNCAIQADQTANDVAPVVFIALVLDKQTNGAQLNSEDVFTNLSANALLAPMPMRDTLFLTRFKVLKTWKLHLDIPTSTYDGTNIEQGGTSKEFSCYMKLNLPVWFKSSAGPSVSDISDNSLHMIAYCNSTAMAPTISYESRVSFLDG